MSILHDASRRNAAVIIEATLAATVQDLCVSLSGASLRLTGRTTSYRLKRAALRAAARLAGGRTIEDHVDVWLPAEARRSDAEIERAIAARFRRERTVPADGVRVRVEDGWVTLDGRTDWHYEKVAAEEAVGSIVGVRGVTSRITLAHETICPTFGYPTALPR